MKTLGPMAAFTMSLRMLALLAGVLTAAVASPARATPFAYLPGGGIIDTATDTVVGGVSGIINIQGGVAMNAAGTRVYMLDLGFLGGNGLKVIDTTSNSVITTVTGVSSFGKVAVNPSGTRVYTADGGGTNLVVVNATTNTVITTVPLGDPIAGIAVHPDGSRVYVAARFGLKVVDTATNTLLTTVPGLAIQPGAVAVNPSGTRVYAGYFDYCGCGGGPTRTAIIDTATNTEIGSIPVYGGGLAINPAGTRLYAADAGASVSVIDLGTNTVVATVPGLSEPTGIAVNPAGTKVYVIQRNSAGTAVIDAATNTVTTTVPGFANPGTGTGLFIGPYCPGACSDLNPCTTDICNPVGGCTYTNNTAPCADDGNPCSTDVCNAGSCTHPPTGSGTSCDDGLFCNGAATCDGAGTCLNAGDPCTGGTECADACNEAADDCFDLLGTTCSTDGNVCTDDQCNGAGACVHSHNTAPCDDGFFCTLTDVCAGGACGGTGDPCEGGSECANICNEIADDCLDPTGTACTADANPCTLDQCDGGGSCAHPPGNAGVTCRSAAGQCDTAETCTGASASCPADGFQPDGTACDDANACTSPDECTGGACTSGNAVICPLCETCDTIGGCVEGPRPSGCKQPTKPLKASILLQDRMPDDLDQVKWRWSNGQETTFAELGDPLATDDYALCVYDAGSNLLLKMTAPAGGTCGTKPCWKQLGPPTLGKGYKYKDLDGLPHDLDVMTIKAGLDGQAKVSLRAKGGNIPMPTLGSLSLPLTTQLQSANGQCYEATTVTPSVNTTTLFKARGD